MTTPHTQGRKCEHGVPFEHPTEYCPVCLKAAMQSEGQVAPRSTRS
jgi:hypothetical protein